MRNDAWVTLGAAAVVLVLVVGVSISVSNYLECREAGFSRIYCVFTHLVRP